MNKIRIGIDIDGTITENAAFFAALTMNPSFEVHILTGRDKADLADTEQELRDACILFDKIHFAENWADKARLCEALRLEILFEDQDEYIASVPESVLVFKPRNGGNWSHADKKWMT